MCITQKIAWDAMLYMEFFKKKSQTVDVRFFVCMRSGEGDNFFHTMPIQQEGQRSPTTCCCDDIWVDTSKEQLNSTADVKAMFQYMLQTCGLPNGVAEI